MFQVSSRSFLQPTHASRLGPVVSPRSVALAVDALDRPELARRRPLAPLHNHEAFHAARAEVVLRQHAAHGATNDLFGAVAKEHVMGVALLQTARVHRVPVVQLLLPLAPRETDEVAIRDGHVVAVLHVRHERRLVLALEQTRDFGREASDGLGRAEAA